MCGAHQVKFQHTLTVDHCHKTGKVGKLLCVRCNSAVELIVDYPQVIKKIGEYIHATRPFSKVI